MKKSPTLVAVISALFAFVFNTQTHANTITVTNTNNSGAGSLRQAIASAAADDTINVPVTGTIVLTGGVLQISNTHLIIEGPGSGLLTINGNGVNRIFLLNSSDVVISGFTLTNAQPSFGAGGAINCNGGSLKLVDCIFTGNTSTQEGGAIFGANTFIQVFNSIISGNSSSGNGGGICSNNTSTSLSNCTISGNSTSMGNGGGISSNSGPLSLTNCTVSGNSTAGMGGGGGIDNNSETLYMFNCTVSGNSTSGPMANGGGISHNGSAVLLMVNCTVANNSTLGLGGGIINNGGGDLQLKNDIFSNVGSNLENLSGTVNSVGHNISSDGTMSAYLNQTGDLNNTNPMINALASNGGPTQTHSLQAGSPAIDAGTTSGAPARDQRDMCRNGNTDIGSYEYNAGLSITVVSAPANGSVCPGSQATLTASGASSYSWTGGVTNGVPFTPSATTTYTVVGTDVNGCTGTAQSTITVNTTPTISIVSNPANGIVCTGNQATLTASGAQSYSWSGGITNAVAFTPAATTTYTVTGTAANGCTATAQRTLTVQSCSGPTTTVPCGATITNKNQSLSAVNVPGATQYRFTFYNNVTLAQVQQVTQTSRTLVFTNTPSLNYGTTYRWTVAVNMGSGFGAESSMNCTINFAVPRTTCPCGVSYNRYNGYSAVTAIYAAAGYRFTFYDNVTNAQVAQVAQTSNYIYFNTVSALQPGTTYKWTVEVRYYNGTNYAYGPASNSNCTVTMGAPTATVPCNATYNKNTGYTAVANTPGNTGYRFTFYQASVQVAQVAQTSNYIYFNTVSGIANGQTYQWTVEVRYNPGSGNVYGPASTPCNVTFSSAARMAYQDELTPEPAFTAFAMIMYPNPLGEGVNPKLTITGADQQEALVSILDLNGRTVATYTLFAEGDEYTTELMNFPDLEAGMYLMQVQVGDKVQTQKFIAE